MTLPRIFIAVTLMLFGGIGAAVYCKKAKTKKQESTAKQESRALQPIEIDLASLSNSSKKQEVVQAEPQIQAAIVQVTGTEETAVPENKALDLLPDVDRVQLLFQKDSPLPIVKTIPYKAKVAWKSGRSAWLVDYASHYKTHLHFIARSLNGRPDYNPKAASDGERFNVLSPDREFHFYLVIDISRCKLWLYTVLDDSQERLLLKTYRCGLGRINNQKASGSLTPVGKYTLGSRIAIFQPKMMGNHKGKRVELMTVFGTRWIPFEKEIGNCSEPAKGFGIHGTPWQPGPDGKLVDNTGSIGHYESDGCIRLCQKDIEELFAIISTHKTIVEIVPEFSKAKLPGNEKI